MHAQLRAVRKRLERARQLRQPEVQSFALSLRLQRRDQPLRQLFPVRVVHPLHEATVATGRFAEQPPASKRRIADSNRELDLLVDLHA